MSPREYQIAELEEKIFQAQQDSDFDREFELEEELRTLRSGGSDATS